MAYKPEKRDRKQELIESIANSVRSVMAVEVKLTDKIIVSMSENSTLQDRQNALELFKQMFPENSGAVLFGVEKIQIVRGEVNEKENEN